LFARLSSFSICYSQAESMASDASPLFRPEPGMTTTKSESTDTEAPAAAGEIAVDSGVELVTEDREFDCHACLFCTKATDSLASNVEHMRKRHGLFIPQERLVVELETLVAYMHLVIYGYHECLDCGLQRNSSEAVRQHMMGKGHCAFDLLDPRSEYRDFYDFGPSQSDAEDDEEHEAEEESGARLGGSRSAIGKTPLIEAVDGTARLPSGKLLSHRKATPPRPANRKALPDKNGMQINFDHGPPASHGPEPSDTAATAAELTRAERRGGFTMDRQLSTLRAADRQSLLHLTTAEQRTVLANQRKTIAKANRDERALQGRVEGLGNKTLMKSFVNDVPGRKNG
jgi:pre-60S factor REI1